MVDGPFTETEELVTGFWILSVKSKDEAIGWVKRVPNPAEGEVEIEIRQCTARLTDAWPAVARRSL